MLGLRCGSRVALDCPRDFLEAPELRRRYSGVQCARSIGRADAELELGEAGALPPRQRAQAAIVTGQCVACHGILGIGVGTNPRMAGQSRGYVLKALYLDAAQSLRNDLKDLKGELYFDDAVLQSSADDFGHVVHKKPVAANPRRATMARRADNLDADDRAPPAVFLPAAGVIFLLGFRLGSRTTCNASADSLAGAPYLPAAAGDFIISVAFFDARWIFLCAGGRRNH